MQPSGLATQISGLPVGPATVGARSYAIGPSAPGGTAPAVADPATASRHRRAAVSGRTRRHSWPFRDRSSLREATGRASVSPSSRLLPSCINVVARPYRSTGAQRNRGKRHPSRRTSRRAKPRCCFEAEAAAVASCPHNEMTECMRDEGARAPDDRGSWYPSPPRSPPRCAGAVSSGAPRSQDGLPDSDRGRRALPDPAGDPARLARAALRSSRPVHRSRADRES